MADNKLNIYSTELAKVTAELASKRTELHNLVRIKTQELVDLQTKIKKEQEFHTTRLSELNTQFVVKQKELNDLEKNIKDRLEYFETEFTKQHAARLRDLVIRENAVTLTEARIKSENIIIQETQRQLYARQEGLTKQIAALDRQAIDLRERENLLNAERVTITQIQIKLNNDINQFQQQQKQFNQDIARQQDIIQHRETEAKKVIERIVEVEQIQKQTRQIETSLKEREEKVNELKIQYMVDASKLARRESQLEELEQKLFRREENLKLLEAGKVGRNGTN